MSSAAEVIREEVQENLALSVDVESTAIVSDKAVEAENREGGETPAVPVEVTPVETSNPEFDDIVEQATTPKAKAANEDHESDETKKISQVEATSGFSHDDSIAYAAMGVNQFVGLVSEQTGVVVNLPQPVQMLLASLLAPAVMKHGDSIQKYIDSKNVDLDSNIPEYMAGAAVVGLVGYTAFSVKSGKKTGIEVVKDSSNDGGEHGDQSQHG